MFVSVGPDLERIVSSLVGEGKGREEEEEDGGVKEERGRRNPKEEQEETKMDLSLPLPHGCREERGPGLVL